MNFSPGLLKTEIQDEHVNVSFPALVMYPTEAQPAAVSFGPFSLTVAQNAPIYPGQFPLVLISHGSGGSYLTHRTLALYLAQRGFVVAIPQHPFNNRLDNSWQYTLENLTHRPRHLRLVTDHVYQHGLFRDSLNPNQVAAIGHSVGSYSAMALAGGKAHTQGLVAYGQRPPQPNEPYWMNLFRQNNLPSQAIEVELDERVKAIVLLAPDLGLFAAPDALTPISAAVMAWVPEQETVLFDTQEILANGLPHSFIYRFVPNSGHYSFLSPFPEAIRQRVGAASQDPPGFDREAFHRELNEEICLFLKKAFKSE